MKCMICGEEHKNISNHVLLKHKISQKDYFDTFLKTYENTHCPACGKELTHFYKISYGYGKYCDRCSGNKYAWTIMSTEQKNEKLRKYKETCLKKYNTDSPTRCEFVKQKIHDTIKNRTPERQQEIHQNKVNAHLKYNIPEMIRKIKATN